MRGLETMVKYRVEIGFVSLILIILLFVFSNKTFLHIQNKQTDVYYLQNGWDIQGTVQGENVDLSTFIFAPLHRGDRIIYSTVLPDVPVDNPVLRFYAVHSAINVYFDHELIYEYGHDLYEKNTMLGYGIQMVDLPSDFAGKEIIIDYLISEDNAFSKLEVPILGNGVDLIKSEMMKVNTPIAIIFFLFIFGIALMSVSVMLSVKNHSFLKLLCIGAFSIGAATWSFCKYDAIFFFSFNPLIKVYLEYLTLYILPITFSLYFYEDVMAHKEETFKSIYLLILGSQIIYTICVIFFQVTNLAHMPKFLYGEHVILLVIIIYMIYMSVYDLFKKQFDHVALIIGMVALLLSGLYDVVFFDLQKHVSYFQQKQYTSMLCMGTLSYIFLQILDFGIEVSRKMRENIETATLERMAYTDALTGIANRRKCEEELEKLDVSEMNYGIFAFDLNNLKEINDSKGHDVGDMMIREFAIILKKIFKENAIVGRMGGDEFIAIVPNVDYVDTETLIKSLEIEINLQNNAKKEFQLSTAYGFCEKREYKDLDVKGIYRKADARMYDMKLSMKQRKESKR